MALLPRSSRVGAVLPAVSDAFHDPTTFVPRRRTYAAVASTEGPTNTGSDLAHRRLTVRRTPHLTSSAFASANFVRWRVRMCSVVPSRYQPSDWPSGSVVPEASGGMTTHGSLPR